MVAIIGPDLLSVAEFVILGISSSPIFTFAMKFLYVFRQRRMAIARVFILFAVVYFAYACLTTREYTALAQAQGYIPGGADAASGDQDDFNGNVRIIESIETVQNVASRLSDADRQRLLAPYSRFFRVGGTPSVAEILYEGRSVSAGRSGMRIDISFQHPDAAAASLVANLFAEDFIKQHDAQNEQKIKRMTDDLQARADAQRQKAEAIKTRMDELMKQVGGTSLDAAAADVYSSAIKDLNQKVIDTKSALDELMLHRQQIEEQAMASKPIWELKFLSSQPRIANLIAVFQQEADKVQQLKNDSYTDDSANVVEARGRQEGAMSQLNGAINAYVQQLLADLEVKQNDYQQAQTRLAEAQKQNQELSQARVEYQSLRSDHETAQKLYSDQQVEISAALTKAKLGAVTYTVIARAEPPASPDPKPWMRIGLASLGWGLGGGLVALAGFAIFLPPPSEQREEYERRRRRHRHFHSSTRRREEKR